MIKRLCLVYIYIDLQRYESFLLSLSKYSITCVIYSKWSNSYWWPIVYDVTLTWWCVRYTSVGVSHQMARLYVVAYNGIDLLRNHSQGKYYKTRFWVSKHYYKDIIMFHSENFVMPLKQLRLFPSTWGNVTYGFHWYHKWNIMMSL
jgi:hypothetical protein